MRLAERLSRVAPRRQGLLLQLRRRGQRGGDQAGAQGPAGRRHRRPCTAPFTGAPTARCRRRRRSQSRRRSRRWCPAFAPSRREPEALGAAIDERTAAVLLEPIQGETGVHVLSEELLRAAREACDEHGAALIFDEIQCGMGRTGTLWAYEQTGVVPDAITTAKALGGGLPIGALVTGARLPTCSRPATTAPRSRAGRSIAAAALAALEVTEDPRAAGAACASSERVSPRVCERLPHVLGVRGRGLMLACELDVPAPAVVRRALLEQRLVVNATGPTTVRLLPPLIIGEDRGRRGARSALRAVLDSAQ